MAWETFPSSYTSPHIHLWIFKTLWVIIFWVRVTPKILNVNCIKIHSIILSFTCHGLRNFPCSYTSPCIHSCIFDSLQVIIFWVRVTHKKLNVTCIKNSLNNFIFHLVWFKKLSPTHRHTLKTIHEFLKPYEWGGVGHTWVGWDAVGHTGVGWGGSCSKTT